MIKQLIAKYKWLYYRLNVMSFKEILYRIKIAYLEKHYQVNPKKNLLNFKNEKIFPSYFLFIDKEELDYDDLNFNCMSDTIEILNTKIKTDEIIWNKDYNNDYIFDNIHFSKLQYHDFENKELKPVLELNRFQFLIEVAYCYKITKNEIYLKQVIQLLESWIDMNQIPFGLIWKSGFGTSIRLISWILVWQIIDFNTINT